MAKSKIIKQFVNNKITTKQALERMLVLAKDIKDKNLEKWIEKELQGYEKSDVVPEYRKIPVCYIGTYDVGFTRSKNVPLPTMFLNDMPQKEKDNFLHKFVELSIDVLEQAIKDKNEISETIKPEYFTLFEQQTNIQVLSARKRYDVVHLNKIVGKVRIKIINILTKLEQEFGCLDELDIDIDSKDENQKQQIYNIINIIIQDNHIDNSITMGNENEISNSSIANKA